MVLLRFLTTLACLIGMMVLSAKSIPREKGKVEKIWPDFSCHPINRKDPGQQPSYNLAKFKWEQCLIMETNAENNLHSNKDCPKICVLSYSFMVYQYCGPKCNVTVDVDNMGSRLSQQNGYESDGQYEGDRLVHEVENKLRKCRDDHPEIVTMSIKDPCEKWNPFLTCVDKAYVSESMLGMCLRALSRNRLGLTIKLCCKI